MDRKRFQRVQELFLRLRTASKEERERLLAEAGEEDPSLQAELEALLADAEESFLETPAWQRTPITRSPEEGGRELGVPPVIGGYRIRERLGEGGMGIVFLAEQESTGRDVALKVIRPGFSSPETRARFEREAKLLARLRHPGIARIFEAGVHDADGDAALPFIAMERVPGPSLLDYLRDTELDEREKIGLLLPICDAIEHAHRQGVVHRDLKPGNVLVDTSGEVPRAMIVDFGIARALEASQATTLRTRPDQILGTVRYMSPEQAQGLEVDGRSDVYALGVVLHELLTGEPPHRLEGCSLPEALRIVTEEDIAPLRAHGTHWPHDLEIVVGKALEKEASRRYASAAELAADLRRVLAHEPIHARSPSVLYRFQKFSRRHRALVASLTIVFLILTVATVVASRAAWSERIQRQKVQRALSAEETARAEAQRQREEAEESRRIADVARQKAEDARVEAERQVQVTQEVNDFLNQDLLAASDPYLSRDRALTVRELLDRAAEKLEGRFPDQPLVEAALRNTLGTAYSGLGLFQEAGRHFERLLELTRAQRGEEHLDTIRAMVLVAVNLDRLGKAQESEPFHRQVLSLRRTRLGDDHPDTLDAVNNLAAWCFYRGGFEEAGQLWQELLERRRELEGEDATGTLNVMVNLAYLYVVTGRLEEAEPMYRHVLERRREKYGDDHPATLRVRVNLAGLYDQAQRWEEAERELVSILEAQRRTLGEDHPDTLLSLNNTASVLKRLGRIDEAERLYREVLERRRRTLGDRHPHTLLSLNNLAVLLDRRRQYDEAAQLYQEAVAGMRATSGTAHPDTLNVSGNYADLLGSAGRHEEALKLLDESLDQAATAGAGSSALQALRFRRARLLARAGRREEAETELADLREALAKNAKAPRDLRRWVLLELADLYEASGRHEDAAACRAEAER
ncbi:MAG: tetratricopeptide repeat protein [Planctomycetota bacterium]